ncbi:phosphate transporter [Propionigenium maris DSM 9537]|uniref:Phosphate transporter n=1 Tax=Propionigenium maris DSM 9537 TaxID=1123000 RepID=A0A9W6GLC0_9FUSO|nr:Na/Pi cotransporter family protein [Propionigenium maris]GLI55851.1 phosphate transporter [Propionigenium maris DSM 9537]
MGLDIFFKVIGGLGIFMYGMHNMSGGMQKLAGDRLKKILAVLTTNRFMAIIMGIFVTGMVQSSSVSTVMTIGFVNAGLLNLKQSLGVILGANIGTTITGWILVLKIGKYGLPIAGIAALLYLFGKSDRAKTRALTTMGLGMIFFGLQLMSDGFKPLRTMPEFIELFHKFQADSLSGVIAAAAVGALMTAIVQSSSATLGITITLAVQGLIDYQTAVALVLGENVGTTITACLASIGARSNAKRAAYAHTIINIVGVIWVTSIFGLYIKFLHNFADPAANVTRFIATAHTMFNVTNVIIFTPFITLIANFLMKIVKDDEEVVESVTHLDIRMADTPTVIISQTKKEILGMAGDISTMMNSLKDIIVSGTEINKNVEQIVELEEKLDLVQKEISDVNFEIMHKDLDEKYIEETRGNLEVADEYETVSDYLTRISKSIKKLNENDILLNNKKKESLEQIHTKVVEFFDYVNTAYENGNKEILVEAMQKSADIKDLYKKARKEHMERVAEHKMPAMLSTAYMDILNHYRRIKDHMVNVVETLSV